MNTETRSSLITILGWLFIIVGAAISVISFIAAMMMIVGSYGTKNADPLEVLAMIAGPPLALVAGIGLLRRKHWARWCVIGILLVVAVKKGSSTLFPPLSEPTVSLSSAGMPTTTFHSEDTFSLPIFIVSIAALALLFSAKARAEFASSTARVLEMESSPTGSTRGDYDAAEDRDIARSWRVGHRGRDQIVYEEYRDGSWQWIIIDGEMLLGRAHHVIYFPSAESWAEHPDWARQRRDEIIARIKSQFREPEYEYADGGTVQAAPIAIPNVPPQPMKPSEFRALLTFLVILLGITGGMAWLVATGLQRGETYWPAKRNSQQRTVSQVKEPVMFWTSVGVYSSIGLGALGFAICMIRWSHK